MNFDVGDLTGPGAIVLDRFVAIAASVAVVDREGCFFRQIDSTPPLERSLGFDGRCGLSQLSLRRVLIKFHRVAGAVNDEHPARTGCLDDFVHVRSHLGDA